MNLFIILFPIFRCFTLFTFFTYYTHVTSNNLWIIRHCDKPKDKRNPCCSNEGYTRSEKWADYFQKYIVYGTEINMLSSNYRDTRKICIADTNYTNTTTNNRCQKSQRMALTTHYLTKKLLEHYTIYNKTQIERQNNPFCVGSSEKIVSYVKEKISSTSKNKNVNKNVNTNTQFILVWEHNEIIDIIRQFGIHIDKWKHKIKNNYDIVFLIDIEKKQLYYSCYNYNNTCSLYVDKWLSKFKKIESYFNVTQKKERDVMLSYNIIILFTIFGVGICIVSLVTIIHHIFIHIQNKYNRYNYIEIIDM